MRLQQTSYAARPLVQRNSILIGNVLAALACAALPAWGALAFSAGEPGDANKPARTIVVTAIEASGRVMFVPALLKVAQGEQIKFVFKNNGEWPHEFVLATETEHSAHAAQNLRAPETHHAEPNARLLLPKQSAELLWRFSKAGEFEYDCSVPGHPDKGAPGQVIVR